MYYGTNFLGDTKFNNYKQHRLCDNNHNCKFLCDIFLGDFLDSQAGRNILKKAPQLCSSSEKFANTNAACIVNS